MEFGIQFKKSRGALISGKILFFLLVMLIFLNISLGDALYLLKWGELQDLTSKIMWLITGGGLFVSCLIIIYYILKFNKLHRLLVILTFLFFMHLTNFIVYHNLTGYKMLWDFITFYKYFFLFIALRLFLHFYPQYIKRIESYYFKILNISLIINLICGYLYFFFGHTGISILDNSYNFESVLRGKAGSLLEGHYFFTLFGGHNAVSAFLGSVLLILIGRYKYKTLTFLFTIVPFLFFLSSKMAKIAFLISLVYFWAKIKRVNIKLIFIIGTLFYSIIATFCYFINIDIYSFHDFGMILNPIKFVQVAIEHGNMRPATYFFAFKIILGDIKNFFFGLGGGFASYFKALGDKTLFEIMVDKYWPKYSPGVGSLFDSQYVQFLVEYGFLYLVLYLIFLLYLFRLFSKLEKTIVVNSNSTIYFRDIIVSKALVIYIFYLGISNSIIGLRALGCTIVVFWVLTLVKVKFILLFNSKLKMKNSTCC